MARIRTIKPEFWTDEKLTECSLSARLFFVGLLNFADDYGNMQRSVKQMKMKIFPADNVDVGELLDELEAIGVVVPYGVDDKKYIHIKGFTTHQLINRPSKPQCPDYHESVKAHETLTEDSSRKGREGKGKDSNEPSEDASLVFDEFWKIYPSRSPHQNPKKPARDSFARKVKNGSTADEIIAGAKRYADLIRTSKTEPQHVAQAVTFLNQERYKDQPDAEKAKPKW